MGQGLTFVKTGTDRATGRRVGLTSDGKVHYISDMPAPEKEGSFFGDSAKALGAGLTLLPRQLVSTGLQAIRGGDIDAEHGAADRFIDETDRQTQDFIRKYGQNDRDSFLGVTPRDVAEASGNLAFSGGSMASGLVAGGATSVLSGGNVAAGYGAGMTAAGTFAYRTAKDQITKQYHDALQAESQQINGRSLTPREWDAYARDFEEKATRYGRWEALPEAIGSGAGFGLIAAPLKRIVGEKLAASMVGKVAGVGAKGAGVLGEELLTETITQAGLPGAPSGGKLKGQAGIEAEAGMRPHDVTFGEGFKEVYGPVAATTAILGPLAGGARMAFNKIVGPRVEQGDPIDTYIARAVNGEDLSAPEDVQFYEANKETIDQRVAELSGQVKEQQPAPEQEAAPAAETVPPRVRPPVEESLRGPVPVAKPPATHPPAPAAQEPIPEWQRKPGQGTPYVPKPAVKSRALRTPEDRQAVIDQMVPDTERQLYEPGDTDPVPFAPVGLPTQEEAAIEEGRKFMELGREFRYMSPQERAIDAGRQLKEADRYGYELPNRAELEALAAKIDEPQATRIPEGLERTGAWVEPVEGEQTPGKAPKPKTEKKKDSFVHDYSNTQVQLSGEDAKAIRQFGESIPDSEVYTEPGGDSYGRETEPHITVRYGLDTLDPNDVKPAFKGMGPIKAKMGKVSIFEADKYDVVKVDIESPDLNAANKRVGETVELPGETHKDYKPHATIAYVKKGEGKKYVGNNNFEGREVEFDSIVLSAKDGKHHEIKLDGEAPAATPEPKAKPPKAPAKEKAPEKPAEPKAKPETPKAEPAENPHIKEYTDDAGNATYHVVDEDGALVDIAGTREAAEAIAAKEFPAEKKPKAKGEDRSNRYKPFNDNKATPGEVNQAVEQAHSEGWKGIIGNRLGEVEYLGQKHLQSIEKAERTAKPKSEPADGPKAVGRNPNGHEVYESKAGTRGYSAAGFVQYQNVRHTPTGGEKDSLQALYDAGKHEFLTTEEVAEFDAAKRPAKPAAPDKSKPAKKLDKQDKQADIKAEAKPHSSADWGANNKIVTADRKAELEKKLRALLNPNQLNAGFNPEIFAVGAELAAFHIEAGARKFADFAKVMVDTVGDGIRPYLKAIYKGARSFPGMEEFHGEMNTDQEVDGADIESVGKGGQDEQIREPSPESTGEPGTEETQGNEEAGRPEPVSEPESDRSPRSERPAGSKGHAGSRSGRSDTERPAGSRVADSDYKITADDKLGSGGAKTKFHNNVAAIKALKRIGDGVATVEDQQILAKYVGWGGIPQAFVRPNGTVANGWEAEAKQLQELLTKEEYAAARSTTQDAHYTSENIIKTMYRALTRFGFTGGRILEPSVGTGNFIGLMPAEIKARSNVVAVEIDPTTSAIARHLYPQQNITNSGFEEFSVTEDSFDAAIGNPPFGSKKLFDAEHRDLRKFSIHNYFFAKSLKAVRPGGVLAMVVSSSMMDKIDSTQREWLAERAVLLGAIRLPNNAFRDNAGTDVTTDIVFLQKKGGEGKAARGPGWTKTRAYKQKGIEYTVNEYFAKHPSHVLGEYGHNKLSPRSLEDALDGDKYKGVPGVVARDGQDTDALVTRVIEKFQDGIYRPWENVEEAEEAAEILVSDPGFAQPYGYTLSDSGKAVRRLPDKNGQMRFELVRYSGKPLEGKRLARFKGLMLLRDATRRLMRAEIADDTAKMDLFRKRLNEQYDKFVKKYGFVSAAVNSQVLSADQTDYPLLRALEKNYDKGVSKAVSKSTGHPQRKASAKKADIFSKRMREPYKSPDKAETASDALGIVLREEGFVDISRVARLYGATPEKAIEDLAGVVFQNPNTEAFETRDKYLSGNVKQKLAEAKAAVSLGKDQYGENVKALEAVIPEDVGPGNIQFNVGAPWIPDDVYMQFASEVLGVDMSIHQLPGVGRWSTQGGTGGKKEFSTEEAPAGYLFDRRLQSRDIMIYYRDSDGTRHFDKGATTRANVKADEIEKRFATWAIEEDTRAERLVKIFNDTINTNIDGTFDGSHLAFPGMATINAGKPHNEQLRPHQSNLVWRLIQKGKGLLDHVVGAGKTFASIATAMEMKRMGLVKKPMFVVPNHLVAQWGEDFRTLYPGANVLVLDKKDFAAKRRQEFLGRIATGDWDAVVIAHSSFGFIQAPLDYERRFMTSQIAEWDRAIEEMRAAEGKKSRTVKQAEKTRDSLKTKLQALNDANRDAVVDFSHLGVDSLFVDEAHMFKNLYYVTSRNRVSGLGDQKGSQKAFNMFLKTRYLLEHNNDRGVFFLTGTPVSNTIAEMYTMMRYLDYDRLKDMGIRHFDQWANMFANVETVWEVDPSGTRYRQQSVFSEFINVPGMMAIYKDFADVISQQDLIDTAKARGEVWPIPDVRGGKPQLVTAKRSGLQKVFMDWIVRRMDNMPRDAKEDNPLKATGEAMKAALDMRLINPAMPDFAGSKPNMAVSNILDIYRKWDARKGTQLVFCDLSVPKKAKSKRANEIRQLIAEVERLQKAVDRNTNLDKQVELESAFEKAAAKLDKINYSERIAVESKFSVYDDIKQKLIKGGVPVEQIAFIHDANTDNQEELFKNVRQGNVRVLIGSTSKMGAGMNVQDRLVALHHLDAPWRPSDLEQREGRIIRQGNIFYEEALDSGDPSTFKVDILRYGTKETLDTRRWQIIERKAKVVGQLRAGAYEWGAGIEDAAGEAANAAEMKAAVSGNPMILEEVQLRQDINTLEASERNFNNAKFAAQRTVRASEDLAKNKEGYFEDIDAAAEKVEPRDDSIEGWQAEIDGQEYRAENLQQAPSAYRSSELPDDVQDAIHEADTIKKAKEYGKQYLAGPEAFEDEKPDLPKGISQGKVAEPSLDAFLDDEKRDRTESGWLASRAWSVSREYAGEELIDAFESVPNGYEDDSGLVSQAEITKQAPAAEPFTVIEGKGNVVEAYRTPAGVRMFQSKYVQYLRDILPNNATFHVDEVGAATFVVDGKPVALVLGVGLESEITSYLHDLEAVTPPFELTAIPKEDQADLKKAINKVVKSRSDILRVERNNTRALKGAQQEFREDLEQKVKDNHGRSGSFEVKLRGVTFTFDRHSTLLSDFKFDPDLDSIDLFRKYLPYQPTGMDFRDVERFSGTRFLTSAHGVIDTVLNRSEHLKAEIEGVERYHKAQVKDAKKTLEKKFDKAAELEGKRTRHAEVLVALAEADQAGQGEGQQDFSMFTNPERYSEEDYADLEKIHAEGSATGLPMSKERAEKSKATMLKHLARDAAKLFDIDDASVFGVTDWDTVSSLSQRIEDHINAEAPSNIYEDEHGWGEDPDEWGELADAEQRKKVWKGLIEHERYETRSEYERRAVDLARTDKKIKARREALATSETFEEAWDALKREYLRKEDTLGYEQQIGGHPQYSTRRKITDSGVTLADVQQIFKGQAVGISPDGTVWARTKAGQGVRIKSVDHIAENKAKFKAGYGRMKRSGEFITGKYSNGTIELQRDMSDRWTLTHETEHWMEDAGLILPNEIKVLKREIKRLVAKGQFETSNSKDIGGKEDRAEYIAQELYKRNHAGTIQRALNRIRDLIDSLVNLFRRTARGIARDFESGKLLEREGRQGKGAGSYKVDGEPARPVGLYPKLKESEIPAKTQKAYKLMKIYKAKHREGILYPLYTKGKDGRQVRGYSLGEWFIAEVDRPEIGGKKLAYRPGIHAVSLPIFSQGKGNPKNENRVWVEVEMPAMSKKTQAENDASPMLDNGQREGIRNRLIGPDEAYNFKTNPTATGADAWPIAGSMKAVRALSDTEVREILTAAGKHEHIENSMTGADQETADNFTGPDIQYSTRQAPDQFEKHKNDWFSEKDWAVHKNSVEARQIQERIRKALGLKSFNLKAQKYDQALHIYLDLKRNPDHAQEYRDQLTSEQKEILRLAETIEDNPELMEIADYLAKEYEMTGFKSLHAGVIFNVLDNYVARAWDIPNKVSSDNVAKFKQTSRHAKQRTFETILQGQARGLKLKVTGASNNLNLLKDEIARTIEDRRLVKRLLNSTTGETYIDQQGKERELTFLSHAHHDGYAAIEHPNFTAWQVTENIKGGLVKQYGKNHRIDSKYAVMKRGNTRATKLFDSEAEAALFIQLTGAQEDHYVEPRHTIWERKKLYAPKDRAERLNKILGTSKLRGVWKIGDTSVIDAITKYNAVFKSWILITSFFHHLAFMRSYLLGTRKKTLKEWNPFTMYQEGRKAIENFQPEVELLVRNGLTLGRMQDWEESIIMYEKTIFGKAMDKMKVTKAKDFFNEVRERQARFLFQAFGAGLKTKAALIEYRNALKEHPEMEENKRAAMVARLINDDFGGLHLQRLERDQTLQHIFRLSFLAPDWCVDPGTRAMTKTGWKYHHELSVGDEIMAFDPETKKLKWSKLKDMYVNENYAGKMIHINNHNRSIRMTPDHKCYVYNFTTKRHDIVKANQLQTNHVIPRAAVYDAPESETYDDFFIKLVGWLVTDGYVKRCTNGLANGDTKEYRYGKIVQSKPDMVKVLKDMGLTYHKDKHNSDHDKFIANYTRHVFNIPNDQFARMEELGISDGLNWEFLEKLTSRQRQLLYDTIMLGDGTGQNRFCGKEKEVFNMTLLQTMMGKPTTFYQQEENCWRTRIIKSNHIYCWGHHDNKQEVDYNGTIWCPSVDTGFWLAEREGLMFLTGNTESNVRSMIKAIKTGKGPEEQELYRQFWTSIITKGAIATFAANLILALGDDDNAWERFKTAWDAGHMRWMDVDITPIYKMMGGQGPEKKYFSLVGHFKDPVKFVVHPVRSAKHKGSVLARMVGEAWSGSDWKGARFTNWDELFGVDDKGVYLTTRKGHHKAGDKKGGKLKGQLTAYGKTGVISAGQIPSYLLSQLRGTQPVQAQNFIAWITGEIEGFDAINRSLGLNTSSTYSSRKSKIAEFSKEYAGKGRKGEAFRRLKKLFEDYNKTLIAKGEAPIKWSEIVKKGNRIRRAERLAA